MLPGMWRTIIVQAVYQILFILLLTYLGTFIFVDESYNLITEPLLSSKNEPTGKMVVYTMVFTTFFLTNMVNQINCRVIDDND